MISNNIVILKTAPELIRIFEKNNLYGNDRENVAEILSSEMVSVEEWNNSMILVATRHLNRETSEKLRYAVPEECIRIADKPDPNKCDMQNTEPYGNC